ncbi:hypothetical protein K8353_16585 [Burkholderia contaminans]|nr:hypothetical protein [Burkholderia contaminans]
MLRLSICAAMFVCGTALAASPGDGAPFAPAASNQVFPPLPPFASLPPGAGGGDDEAQAPTPTGGRHARKLRHAPPVKKAPEFQVRLVVTDESRAALAAEDKKLDDALAKSTHDRRATGTGAAALAMTQ